jgi:hypothetical protein
MMIREKCPLCAGTLSKQSSIYDVCGLCGINIKRNFISKEITNESLDKNSIVKIDGLTRFKIATALKADKNQIGILDIGSASGKFPYHSRSLFKFVQGVEVNKTCIIFAEKELNIKLVESLDLIDFNNVSCVTFWHSLEHIPLNVAQDIMKRIAELQGDTPVIISVPNATSYQFKIFKTNWPYYDQASHLYQYSPDALNILMSQNGFSLIRRRIGLMYEFFGYLQGYLNKCHPISNYYYYRKKRGWDFNLSKNKILLFDFYNYLLLILMLPLAILSLLLSLNGNEGVINYIYQKNGKKITKT